MSKSWIATLHSHDNGETVDILRQGCTVLLEGDGWQDWKYSIAHVFDTSDEHIGVNGLFLNQPDEAYEGPEFGEIYPENFCQVLGYFKKDGEWVDVVIDGVLRIAYQDAVTGEGQYVEYRPN